MIKNIIKNEYELIIKENYLDIKNYLKIIELSNNKIELELKDKKMIIEGQNLLIKCMDEYEIIIKGLISSILFYYE